MRNNYLITGIVCLCGALLLVMGGLGSPRETLGPSVAMAGGAVGFAVAGGLCLVANAVAGLRGEPERRRGPVGASRESTDRPLP